MKLITRSIAACCLASAMALAGNLGFAQPRATNSGETENAFDSGATLNTIESAGPPSAFAMPEAQSTFVWQVREISLSGLPSIWGPHLLKPHERILWAQWADGALTLGIQGLVDTAPMESLRVLWLQAVPGGAQGFESRLLAPQAGPQGSAGVLSTGSSPGLPQGWFLASQSFHTDGHEPRHLALLVGPPVVQQQTQLPRSLIRWLRGSGWRAVADEPQTWMATAGHRLTITRLGISDSPAAHSSAARGQQSLWLWSVRMHQPMPVRQPHPRRPS